MKKNYRAKQGLLGPLVVTQNVLTKIGLTTVQNYRLYSSRLALHSWDVNYLKTFTNWTSNTRSKRIHKTASRKLWKPFWESYATFCYKDEALRSFQWKHANMGALCKNKHQERERKPRKRYSVLKRFLPSFVSPHTQLRFYFIFFVYKIL